MLQLVSFDFTRVKDRHMGANKDESEVMKLRDMRFAFVSLKSEILDYGMLCFRLTVLLLQCECLTSGAMHLVCSQKRLMRTVLNCVIDVR